MRRIFFAATLIALLTAGCKDTVPVADPFVNRTIIPPPPTGTATGRVPDANYQPPSMSPPSISGHNTMAPPSIQMPGTATAPSPVPGPTATPAPMAGTTTPSPYPSNSPAPSGTGFAPSATPNYNAPRPSSTMPRSAPAIPTPTTGTTPGGSPYLPPNSNFNSAPTDRGTSWQRNGAPITNVSTPPNNALLDNRSPYPIDNTSTQNQNTRGGQVPIVQTIQPRSPTGTSDQPVDILDLPKAP